MYLFAAEYLVLGGLFHAGCESDLGTLGKLGRRLDRAKRGLARRALECVGQGYLIDVLGERGEEGRIRLCLLRR